MLPVPLKISVIIPAYNAEHMLAQSLDALARSARPADQIIVVDDGSTDATSAVAVERGASVLNIGGRCGPARARNLGAQAATGDLLYFVDADVCVKPGTLERIAKDFEDPTLDALIGSYDDDPASPDFLSQYRNLMHCFVHQRARTEATTFWSGCGAIRRTVFLEFSGFDEGYRRPAIEDIELGYRLTQAGRRIVLDRELKVKHLKKWTFFNLLKTDIVDRGIPWTELILRDHRMPDDLNVQLSQRVSVALVYLALSLAALCAIRWHAYFLTPFFAFLFLLLARYWSDGAQRPKWAPALLASGALALVALAWATHMIGLIPMVLLSIPALLLRHRYEDESTLRNKLMRSASVLCLLGGLGAILYYLPTRPEVFGLGAILLVTLLLNMQFFVFLAGRRGRWFALAAIPFHLLYHLYNGLSFVIGLIRWTLSGKPRRRPAGDTRRAVAAAASASTHEQP